MANSNPMVPQGTLNRLRGSLKFVANPALNVTAPFLGKAGVSLSFEGEATTNIPTMTGTTTSPEPYIIVRVTADILKTNGLASAFQAQLQTTSVIGDFVFTPDTSALGTFYINNASITNPGEIAATGESATWPLTLVGYWIVNNNLWSLT